MSVIVTTLNSKFIHSNLALRYLKEYVRDVEDILIEEYTINQNLAEIASKIYELKPKLVGFSTYIWNVDETLEICERLKLVSPHTKILLGGPEVSYDMEELLTGHPYIDYIVYGEGEETFRELLIKKNPESIKGLAFREDGKIRVNPQRPLIKDINSIPSPYESIGDEFKNKIVYYESSRGCPFNCAFCLSSTIRGVRYMNLDRVKRDLDNLIDVGVKQVKFVDRTFNANKELSQAIMSHIIERNPVGINFHFEVTAHLIDNEQLEFFKNIKEGMFQFEIGVQSTNPKTIEAIGRNTNFERLSNVTRSIKQNKNIHQHLDLIAGLPYEDYDRFGLSFDQIFQIRPEKIQLGFLKLLKGSALRNLRNEYGYRLIDKAPYEVMESKWISYDDIIALKGIEELVEKYYNEEYFKHSIEYILQNQFDSSFKFFEDFMKFWKKQDLYDVSHSKDSLYEILIDYYTERSFDQFEIFIELLAFDYLQNNKGKPLPVYFKIENDSDMTRSHELLKSEALLSEILPEFKEITTKKLLKKVRIQEFEHNLYEIINSGYSKKCNKQKTLILFNYKDGVLERCKTFNITSYEEELTE